MYKHSQQRRTDQPSQSISHADSSLRNLRSKNDTSNYNSELKYNPYSMAMVYEMSEQQYKSSDQPGSQQKFGSRPNVLSNETPKTSHVNELRGERGSLPNNYESKLDQNQLRTNKTSLNMEKGLKQTGIKATNQRNISASDDDRFESSGNFNIKNQKGESEQESYQNMLQGEERGINSGYSISGGENEFQSQLVSYLRKLYFALFVQTVLVLISAYLASQSPQIMKFCTQQKWLLWMCLLAVLGVTLVCFLFRYSMTGQNGNTLAFSIQTFLLAVIFVYIIDYYKLGLPLFMLVALAAVYFALLIYVLTSKSELNVRGSTLFVTFTALIVYHLFLIFTDLSVHTSIFLLMALVIWGYFLVYNSQTLVSEIHSQLRDPLLNAVTVPLDIFALLLKAAELLRQIFLKEHS